ncbi:MAG TPA: peptidyl-prolyl cis-trans isomerase [Polyangia bacterium]
MWRAAVVVALVAGGCTRATPEGAPAATLSAEARDEVVATVDGRPIFAGDVALQARAAGVDRKTALDQLVDAEALAGEAARRGFDRDLEVRDEAKGAMVRRYLKLGFEPTLSPADVPDVVVRREYQRNLPYLEHGVYADVWHMLVPVPANAAPEVKAAARARAESLAKRARGLSLDAFKQLGADEKLRVEEIVTARDGWVERPFSEAAFTLEQPGDTSGVVQTSYGFHVLWLVRFIPPAHVSLSEATPKLRAAAFPELQKRMFAKLVEEAMGRHKIELHPEHLR